jgi:hypothetical protein
MVAWITQLVNRKVIILKQKGLEFRDGGGRKVKRERERELAASANG